MLTPQDITYLAKLVGYSRQLVKLVHEGDQANPKVRAALQQMEDFKKALEPFHKQAKKAESAAVIPTATAAA